ncbi:hypothetical protein [Enorma phocaeensis]|uniref:hypothetical protein n=1 Tax=Enorma phocaeensis TaxID=1871019 RepID=UPI0019570D6C|nr:hypothetical protein [Enorma phocaeensis]MBM6953987.1 hypothetical protein [Enorma phocaeensis]
MAIAPVAGPEEKSVAVAKKADGPSHTRQPCGCRDVFSPKHGRKAVYDEYRKDLALTSRNLCRWKGDGGHGGAPGHA